jgi:hypothetical protein
VQSIWSLHQASQDHCSKSFVTTINIDSRQLFLYNMGNEKRESEVLFERRDEEQPFLAIEDEEECDFEAKPRSRPWLILFGLFAIVSILFYTRTPCMYTGIIMAVQRLTLGRSYLKLHTSSHSTCQLTHRAVRHNDFTFKSSSKKYRGRQQHCSMRQRDLQTVRKTNSRFLVSRPKTA